MRKLVTAAMCILILSLAAACTAGLVFRKAPLKSIVSMYADGEGGYYCIEINNSRYSFSHIDENGAVLTEARLTCRFRGYFYSCNGIVADENKNVYIASYEKDALQRIHAKYVQVFDKRGKKSKIIFETPLDAEKPDETEKLKSLQYSNGKVSMFEMLSEGRLLRYEYDCATGQEQRIEYIIHDGVKMMEAMYSEEGGVFYTTDTGEIYRVNAFNVTERLDVSLGMEKVIPMRLSYNDRNLYFTDVHNFTFVKYDLNTRETETLYTADDNIGYGLRFRDLRFVRWYNGGLYAHSPIFRSGGFLIRLDGEQNVIWSKTRNGAAVFVFAAGLSAIVFAALSLGVFIAYMVIRLRSLLLKQLIILAVLMSAPVLFITAEFANMLSKQITNEVYAQLYMLSVSIASNIDGHVFRGLDFPADIHSDYINSLGSGIRLGMDNFEHPNEDFIPKSLFYNLYTIEDGVAYYAYGFDYTSGMRDEYMLEQANAVFENNPDYKPVTLEYMDKYGRWAVCRAFIMDGGEPAGFLEVGIRRDMVDTKVREITINNIAKASFIAAGGMVILGIMLRRLLKGIKVLKEGLGLMTDGNWHTRVDIRTGDEIEDIANDFNRMARHIEKYVVSVTKLNAAYKKFVPNELFELLDKKNIFEIELGDQADKNLTIMSVSIRDFNSISKRLEARECFDILNGVFAASSRAIRKKDGFIESFGGFGLRAVFMGDADGAIDSALRIIEKTNTSNKEGGIRIQLNITVQNADSMIGIAGDSERMAETVISEASGNISALEKIAERYQIGLLVTEDAINKIGRKERFDYCRIGTFDSESRIIALYDIIDAYEPAKRSIRASVKSDFESGLALYENGLLREARKKFAEVLRTDRTNEIAKLYLFGCDKENNETGGRRTIAI